MIRLDDVTKEYDQPGAQPNLLIAADHLSLEVPAGEVFGLIGPNGAGKTTTLKMICGLLSPTAGKIAVNEVDVERQPDEAQRHIGYLADFFSVYGNLKVWEYVDHFARAYKLDPALIPSRVRDVISLVGLESKAASFVEALSRGMKQRLGIARAIVHASAHASSSRRLAAFALRKACLSGHSSFLPLFFFWNRQRGKRDPASG